MEARPRSPGPAVYFAKDICIATCKIEEFWPSLARETGAGVLEIIAQATAEEGVSAVLDLEFANDSLFCEWAYVIDLDDEAFEVFAGAKSKDKTSSKRFDEIGGRRDTVPALVKSFSFTELPTTEDEFIGILNRALEGLDI
jgi:hypothetical protein